MRLRALKWMTLCMLAFTMVACGGKGQNRKLVEAAEIHKDMMNRYDSLYHSLKDKEKEINARIESLGPEQKSANESMLRSIKKSVGILDGWEESVVGVPGYEFDYHDHSHGDGDHDHDHSHDHKHTRDNDELLRGMSDQEVLDLQKALNGRLKEVEVEIKNLLETIKMYEQRGN